MVTVCFPIISSTSRPRSCPSPTATPSWTIPNNSSARASTSIMWSQKRNQLAPLMNQKAVSRGFGLLEGWLWWGSDCFLSGKGANTKNPASKGAASRRPKFWHYHSFVLSNDMEVKMFDENITAVNVAAFLGWASRCLLLSVARIGENCRVEVARWHFLLRDAAP